MPMAMAILPYWSIQWILGVGNLLKNVETTYITILLKSLVKTPFISKHIRLVSVSLSSALLFSKFGGTYRYGNSVCVFVCHMFSYHPFYVDFHSECV